MLGVAGCGFVPAHGPGGAAAALRGATAITAPESVDGFRLLTRLEDRLGRTAAARWHLTVTPEVAEAAAAVGEDGSISRYNLTGTAAYRLAEVAGGAVIDSGEVRAFAGHGTAGSTVATRAAAADARDRLMVMLADAIVTRLIALPLDG